MLIWGILGKTALHTWATMHVQNDFTVQSTHVYIQNLCIYMQLVVMYDRAARCGKAGQMLNGCGH